MLKLNIKTTNVKLDDFLNDYIREKIGNLDKFIEGVDMNAQAWVEVGKPSKHHKKGADEFYAEANIELPGCGKVLIRAEANQWDLKMAIDELKEKLQSELTRFKEKIETKNKRKARLTKNLLRLSPINWFDWIKRKKN